MTKTLGRLALGALAVASAAGGCDATQPRPSCRAQAAEYAARYTEVPGSRMGACDGKVLSGEILHLQTYRAKPGDTNPAAQVAIEPESIAHAVEEAEHAMMAVSGMEYSIGKYATAQPDDKDVCTIDGAMTEAAVTAGATQLSYKWSNLKMLVTPPLNGIHFGADLVRRDGACTITYKVTAVYPALHCGDGKDPMTMEPDPSTGKPDPTVCVPDPEGSDKGLSPALSYECDASPDGMQGTHLCLPKGDFPSWSTPK